MVFKDRGIGSTCQSCEEQEKPLKEEMQGKILKRKSQIPVSNYVKPVGDSTDVTLAGQDVQHVIAHKMILSSENPSMEVDEELFSDPLEEKDNSCDEIKGTRIPVNKDTKFPVHHTVTQLPPVAPWRRPPSSPPPTPHPPTVNSTLPRSTPCVVSKWDSSKVLPTMRHHRPRSFGLWL